MPTPSIRRLAVTAAIVTGALGMGVAFAAWTTSGSGSGRAAAITPVTLTITARTGTADLYPGFALGDLYFTVANPNPYPVRLTSASLSTVTSSDTTNCASSNVTVAASASGLTLDVPANSVGTSLSIADVVTMAAGAPDGCQSKTFNVGLTLSGTQV